MADDPIRIGVVGASATQGWARAAHIPALKAVEGVRLTAVATTRQDSAEAAAQAFGARHAFTDAAALAACPDVDLVVVSVKAPQHFPAAMAAIRAGKVVFCEWPMGASLSHSRELASAAAAAGVRSFVGLQARAAPPTLTARRLVTEGYLGRLYSASMWGAFSYWGDPVTAAYSADVASGANVLTIPGGHGLDAMSFILGEPVERLWGRETHLRPTVTAADRSAPVPMSAPDQFAAVGELSSGATVSAHICGVAPWGESWRLQLVGDRGELLLESDGMPEIAPLRLSGTSERGRPLAPIASDPAAPAPDGAATNVAYLWASIAADLHDGTRTAPDFGDGAAIRATVDAIARSHAAGGAPVEPSKL